MNTYDNNDSLADDTQVSSKRDALKMLGVGAGVGTLSALISSSASAQTSPTIAFGVARTVEDLKAASGILLVDDTSLDASKLEGIANQGAIIQTTWYSSDSKSGGGVYEIKTLAQHRIDIDDDLWEPDGFGDHYLLGDTDYIAILQVKDVVDCKQFGAVANGDPATDDAPSVQAAIDYCDKINGKVYFPQGKYVLQSQILMKSVSLIGDAQRASEIFCKFEGIQFLILETIKYSEIKHLRFSGEFSNTCFSAAENGAGFFGIEWESLRFSDFNICLDFDFSLFNNFRNVHFRNSEYGIKMNNPKGSYHNQNHIGAGCYFDKCNKAGIYFDAKSNGSSLLLNGATFDHCFIGVDARRPVEASLFYSERNETGIRAIGTSVQIGRAYFLGDSGSSSDKTGILSENSTIIQLGHWNIVDKFNYGIDLRQDSIFNNLSREAWSGSNLISVDETSVQYAFRDDIEQLKLSASAAPYATVIKNLDSVAQEVGSSRFDKSCQYVCKIETVDGDRASFVFGLRLDKGVAWRAEAHGGSVPVLNRISGSSWSCSGLGDGRTYTFSVDGIYGTMTVACDTLAAGNTIISVHGIDNIPI